MSANYKEAPRGAPKEELEKYATGIYLVGNFVDSLQRKGLLPKRFATAAEPKADTRTAVETALMFKPFTDEDKEKLRLEGGVVYTLEGQSLKSQKEAGRGFWSTWHNGQAIELMTSRLIDVVIYPQDFFVPGTFRQTKPRQEQLVQKSGQAMQKKLGIAGYEEILPELPEATEVMFRHFDETGVRLLGEDYRDPENGYWRYIRTNTPTNDSGSGVAGVGSFRADDGPNVGGWDARRGDVGLGAARWGMKINRVR